MHESLQLQESHYAPYYAIYIINHVRDPIKCLLHVKLGNVDTCQKWGEARILVGEPEGKRPLGRPRRRWEDNIRMDLREIGWGGMDWIDLTQDRDQWRAFVNTVMNLWVQ
jgi:hypothetical protein